MGDGLLPHPQFTLVLSGVNKVIFTRFSVFLYIIAVAVVALFVAYSVKPLISVLSAGCMVLSAALLLYFIKVKRGSLASSLLIAIWPLAVAFACLGYFVAGCLFLLLFFINYKQSQVVTVNVYEGGVIIKSFPKKKIQWPRLNNMLLKDGLLTIDQKNNRLFQQAIINYHEVEEAAFNSFCRLKIENF